MAPTRTASVVLLTSITLFITAPCTTNAQECVELEQCLANARFGHTYNTLCEVFSGNWNSKCGSKSAMADNCEKYTKGPFCDPDSFTGGIGWSSLFYSGSSGNSKSRYAGNSYFVAGLACGQDYCGKMSAFSIPRPICHERGPDGTFPSSHTYEVKRVTDDGDISINRRICPNGYAVSRVRCKGDGCDDIYLTCTNVGRCSLGGGQSLSSMFSEEVEQDRKAGAVCGPGQVMNGLYCEGNYCDNKRIYCRTLNPPSKSRITVAQTLRTVGVLNECIVREPDNNLVMAACSSGSEYFGFTHDWQLQMNNGQCMTLGTNSEGHNVYASSCDVTDPEHHWTYDGPGSLIKSAAKPGWCLQVALQPPFNVMAAPCDIRVTNQQWNFV